MHFLWPLYSSYASCSKDLFRQSVVIIGSFPLWERETSPYTRQPIHFPSFCICSCPLLLPVSASSLPPFSGILGKVPVTLFFSLSFCPCIPLLSGRQRPFNPTGTQEFVCVKLCKNVRKTKFLTSP